VGVARRIVFPVIRLLLWAVIAVALAKLAFGAVPEADAAPATPGATLADPQVVVARGSVTNTVTVTGSITADAATDVRATLAGTVSKVLATAGQHVDAATPVVEIRQETPQEPVTSTDPSTGEQVVTARPPKVTKVTVTAGSAGTLATLTALKDQIVSVGDVVGTVSPGTLSVTGSLLPEQQYRLLSPPTEAAITVKGGPAPFTCTGLRLGAPAAHGSGDGPPGDGSANPSASVTCAVPAGVTVFTGMAADMAITAGAAEDVLVVPVTAVQGSVQNGKVWVVGDDSAGVETPVTLGLTDGQVVEVTGGLQEGASVLEFIPVGDVAVPEDGKPSAGAKG
jgi:hypothetical protein